MIIGRQLTAARALADLTQAELAAAANISVPMLQRMEASDVPAEDMKNDVAAVVGALEAAGVRLIDGSYSGAGGPGVRLASPVGASVDVDEAQTVQYEEHLTNDAPPGAGG
ncbi:transcriptional regulator with XRE-family HTH domain [Rhizobium sp. BK529]|uniref:helix-turn-helix domain-containing protein n=1 Tax=Rhizobium sp. BK529 TaxID=2586983 RepID=UPI001616AB88|nr:helix-turn-helix transcriptional regulator [Rhizobium sp. BK529]MBB3595895.1 transcriptional regulator with XRE-family HTH domain [Rhizobium sp. BK529]